MSRATLLPPAPAILAASRPLRMQLDRHHPAGFALALALGVVLAALAFGACGCALSTQDQAVVAANEVHAVAVTERDAIDAYCTPRYVAASTKLDLATADKVCLPARTAYGATVAAWTALVAVLHQAKVGAATDAEVEASAAALATAIAGVRLAVGVLR